MMIQYEEKENLTFMQVYYIIGKLKIKYVYVYGYRQ
jgi:hypothetical protein